MNRQVPIFSERGFYETVHSDFRFKNTEEFGAIKCTTYEYERYWLTLLQWKASFQIQLNSIDTHTLYVKVGEGEVHLKSDSEDIVMTSTLRTGTILKGYESGAWEIKGDSGLQVHVFHAVQDLKLSITGSELHES